MTKLIFDGRKLCFVEEDSKTNEERCVKCWRARSGVLSDDGNTQMGKDKQKEKDEGPVPEGRYTVSVEELEKSYETQGPNKGKLKEGDRQKEWMKSPSLWGDTRVLIKPKTGTETHGRDGFFIHGGDEFGSIGCIDLSRASKAFFTYWELNYDAKGVKEQPIELVVDYSGRSMPDNCIEPDL